MKTKTRTDKFIQRQKRLDKFVDALTEFLVGNQAAKSIALEIETKTKTGSPLEDYIAQNVCPKWAAEWAKLRNATPLFGYPTVEEAKRTLKAFLAGESA
jgi:hypothetical protein